jgi:hypothetical protein
MKKLSPAMARLVHALEIHGNIDPVRDLGRMGLHTAARTTTGTVDALIRRGILREWDPWTKVYHRATTPAQVYADAMEEQLRRAFERGELSVTREGLEAMIPVMHAWYNEH